MVCFFARIPFCWVDFSSSFGVLLAFRQEVRGFVGFWRNNMLVVGRRLRKVALVWIFCRVVLTHVSLLSNLVFGVLERKVRSSRCLKWLTKNKQFVKQI